MSYNIIAVPKFKREFKKLAKRFPSLKSDFSTLLEYLQKNPQQGTILGSHCEQTRTTQKSTDQSETILQGSRFRNIREHR